MTESASTRDDSELSYARGDAAPPLLIETIGATLARITERHGDRMALIDAPTGASGPTPSSAVTSSRSPPDCADSASPQEIGSVCGRPTGPNGC